MLQQITSIGYHIEDEFGNNARNSNGTYALEYKTDWEIRKFADKLKQIAALLIGAYPAKMEDIDFKNSILPREWEYYADGDVVNGNTMHILKSMTVRELLQKLGTEAIRNNLHPNAWVNALFADYNDPNIRRTPQEWFDFTPSNWIVTDMRFPNEFEAIKKRGGLVFRIHRKKPKDLHISETALDSVPVEEWDYVINNHGNLEQLYLIAKDIVETFKLT